MTGPDMVAIRRAARLGGLATRCIRRAGRVERSALGWTVEEAWWLVRAEAFLRAAVAV